MKLTEKDLHYVIAEATKRIIKEHTNPLGYAEYEGEDMSYESVYNNAEHALITGMSNEKHYSSVKELIDALYDSASFNETDYETVYDACEQAMMDVYEDNINENISKLTEYDLKYVISETVKKIIKEAYRDEFGRIWQRGGYTHRDGMTGGSWGSSNVKGVYNINIQDFFEKLPEDIDDDYIENKLNSLKDELYFNVTGTYEYDDSVGMQPRYTDILVDYTPAMNAIKNISLFRGDEIAELKKLILQIAEKVEKGYGEGVEWY
jgi:hypothetical protein